MSFLIVHELGNDQPCDESFAGTGRAILGASMKRRMASLGLDWKAAAICCLAACRASSTRATAWADKAE